MSNNSRLNEVIIITETEIDFEINTLKNCAQNLLTHAKQAEQLIKDINNGSGYYSGFFTFAEENARNAMKAEERINSLRSTLAKLKFFSDENE